MDIIIVILVAVLAVVTIKSQLFSFRAQKPEEYKGTAPAFSIRTYLAGDILCEGLIYGPAGRIANSFVARMTGHWDGYCGTLMEEFTYSNGKTQSRKWFLKQGPDNNFIATADEIIGEAKGVVSGVTIRMKYKMVLPEDAGGHVLDVND